MVLRRPGVRAMGQAAPNRLHGFDCWGWPSLHIFPRSGASTWLPSDVGVRLNATGTAGFRRPAWLLGCLAAWLLGCLPSTHAIWYAALPQALQQPRDMLLLTRESTCMRRRQATALGAPRQGRERTGLQASALGQREAQDESTNRK